MNIKLSVVGILVSIIYTIAIVAFTYHKLFELSNLRLNELGDFLAGLFGPLAILWLILGFFQQGIELKRNTEALKLQAEELKKSVEQQKELVDISREQLNAEIRSVDYERELQRKSRQPQFVTGGVGGTRSGGKTMFNLNVKNVGNTATDIHISFSQTMHKISPSFISSWQNGQEIRVDFAYENWEPTENSKLVLNYLDLSGESGEHIYYFKLTDKYDYPMIEIDKSKS